MCKKIICEGVRIKTKFIRRLAAVSYFLESWPHYQKTKKFVYDLLENDDYVYKKFFDMFMITIIMSSVIILVIDVKKHIPQWLDDYDLYFVTSVFITEYLLRMWVYNDIHKIVIEAYEESRFFDTTLSLATLTRKILKSKWEYIVSPSAIIDLIAILPSYRHIRILRVLVLFRAFKMLRYTKSLTGFLYILKNKKVELITLLTLSGFFVFIAGIMLYVFEGANGNPAIHNLFDAFYWALVTISTVGYGDITPTTPEGRAVSMIIIMTGIGLISFVTSVIVSSFSERLSTLREDRVVQEIGKKRDITVLCGFGLLGRLVAKDLEVEGVEFVVLDADEDAAAKAQNLGYRAICADATKSDVFKRLGVSNRISNVLALTSDDEQNAFISINVKSLNKDVYVTSRCSDMQIAEKLRFAGVDKVIIPEEIAGMMGAVYAGEPAAFEVALSIIEYKERTHVDEIRILPGSAMEGSTIKEVDFDALRLILLGVFRYDESHHGRFIFNPEDDFTLEAGDDLVCIGYDVAIANLKKKVQKRA